MDLDKEIKDYYRSRRLTPESVARIRARTQPRTVRRGLWLAAAAGVLFAVGIGLWSPWSGGQAPENPALVQLRQEVIKNHRKHPEPEIRTEDLALLARSLNDLPFDLNRAADAMPSGFRLRGGRHCSLLGRPAAQIHLVSDGAGRGSLYITTAKQLPGKTGASHGALNGINVKTWEARGLFFALASE